MPKQKKICRVCGAAYEACRSIKTGDTAFNWREVACSPECGTVYLQNVMAARNTSKHSVSDTTHKKKRAKAEEVAGVEVPELSQVPIEPAALDDEHADEE